MFAPRSLLPCLFGLATALGGALAASAVTVDWVAVNGAGNACDSQAQGCFGTVANEFKVSRTEVTNTQYAAFLNAVAQSDPNALYHPAMASSGRAGYGGIVRSGTAGAYSYAAVAGRESWPVNYVSFYDALRFANWLHNGEPIGPQGPATTESGAYDITAQGISGNSIARNPGALVALASEDEWYKAAYYDTATATWFDYPAGSNTASVCTPPASTANSANCNVAGGTPGVGNITEVGSYPGAASPNGTLDQGGNVWEWNEAVVDGTNRGLRGGSFNVKRSNLAAASRSYTVPDAESSIMGFRVVNLPEPARNLLLFAGALGVACLRGIRRSARRTDMLEIRPIAVLAIAALLVARTAVADYYDGSQTELLGGVHGGSFAWDYCQGKPDPTPIPPDPRSHVQPAMPDGRPAANAGKAVVYNTYWKNCHLYTESGVTAANQEVGAAETCGELRGRFDRGALLLDTGSTHPGGLFTGTDPNSNQSTSTFSASDYNNIWQVWGGYAERPANFDELATERYGSAFGPSPNPYPLPNEVNAIPANGGSGKLPELFTQLRNGDGSWSGQITVTCHGCHSGNVGGVGLYGGGPGLTYGGGSSLADLNLFLRDFLQVGYEASAAVVLNLNHTRGRNNASLINLAFAAAGQGAVLNLPGIIQSGTTADLDTPAWWNMGHRPKKFVDGVFAMDSPRVDAVFYAPHIGISPTDQQWMRTNGPDLNTWIETLKSPPYPFTVDTALAEQGAVLFHTLDLWAPERNNGVPAPTDPTTGERVGNGSCASCHGAYSQRYVNDPAFLDTPELEGVASYVTPRDIIGTDPVRLDSNNDSVQTSGRDSFFGYPQSKGTAQDCGPQNGPALRGDRLPGYLAPPLYGIWATAPYLHNGSVPNLWELLKPSDRKRIWKRWSRSTASLEPPSTLNTLGSLITGYATNTTSVPDYYGTGEVQSAYDAEKVGWKYDEIQCQVENATNPSVSPYVNCTPSDADQQDPLAEQILTELYSNVLLAWNIFFPPPLTPTQMEDRKIFNTWMFAQGNQGHEFNAVLTDDERRAIIEYLKTL
jgi:formylglycine-generating enzyme required for sulfatase activity